MAYKMAPQATGKKDAVLVDEVTRRRVQRYMATHRMSRTMAGLGISYRLLVEASTGGRMLRRTLNRLIAKLDELEAIDAAGVGEP